MSRLATLLVVVGLCTASDAHAAGSIGSRILRLIRPLERGRRPVVKPVDARRYLAGQGRPTGAELMEAVSSLFDKRGVRAPAVDAPRLHRALWQAQRSAEASGANDVELARLGDVLKIQNVKQGNRSAELPAIRISLRRKGVLRKRWKLVAEERFVRPQTRDPHWPYAEWTGMQERATPVGLLTNFLGTTDSYTMPLGTYRNFAYRPIRPSNAVLTRAGEQSVAAALAGLGARELLGAPSRALPAPNKALPAPNKALPASPSR